MWCHPPGLKKKKILYYPPAAWGETKINQLLKGAAPIDHNMWVKFACILHNKKFDTFESAADFVTQIIEKPANGTDSEADNVTLNLLINAQANLKSIIKKKQKKPVDAKSANVNNMFINNNASTSTSAQSQTVTAITANSTPPTVEGSTISGNDSLVHLDIQPIDNFLDESGMRMLNNLIHNEAPQ